MNDLIINASVVKGSISFNYADTKNRLEEILKEYNGALFLSEETIKEGKKVVAMLRAEKKKFDDRRKLVKNEFLEPLNEFEKEAKEIIALFDKPIDFINNQIVESENKRKAEKQLQISEIYNQIVGIGGNSIIPLEKIFNDKWLNATFKISEVEKEINEIYAKYLEDMEFINTVPDDCKEKSIEIYKNTGSLLEVTRFVNQYVIQKQQIIEQQKLENENKKKREEEELHERIRQEERRKFEEELRIEREKKELEDRVKEETRQELLQCKSPMKEIEFVATLQYEYLVSCTQEEKEQLEMYMNSIGISFMQI